MSNIRKRHTPEQVVRKLGQADRMLADGSDIAAVCRELGISEQTYYRWRNQYGCIRCCGERVDEIMGQQAQCRWLLERYQVFDPAGDNERHESQQALQRLQEPTPSQDWLAAAQALIRLRTEA